MTIVDEASFAVKKIKYVSMLVLYTDPYWLFITGQNSKNFLRNITV